MLLNPKIDTKKTISFLIVLICFISFKNIKYAKCKQTNTY